MTRSNEIGALKTIKFHNRRWSKSKCLKFVNDLIDNFIFKKYPEGIPENQFLVLPGYEHVNRDQPIVTYNNSISQYQLGTITKFYLENTLILNNE
jgi:hypothetical protein